MATKTNLQKDLSSLLRIPTTTFEVLTEKSNLCIGSMIYEGIKAGEEALIINIGIGTLSINLNDMQCKFIPSRELKRTIKQGISGEIDPLTRELDEIFVSKLILACKDIL